MTAFVLFVAVNEVFERITPSGKEYSKIRDANKKLKDAYSDSKSLRMKAYTGLYPTPKDAR